MSLALLFPLGLAALAAWALPLLLHLVRREKQQPTEFAALRWLAVRAKPRQRLRFDERLLLAVRLALIAACALLLARPAVVGGGGGETAWEVVHPGVPVAAVAADDGVERRWLADGFPPLDAPAPAAPAATASLLRQLDAELPPGASLAVRVPATLDGLDGERIRLSRPVRWLVGGEAPRDAGPGRADAADALPDGPPRVPRLPLAIRHDEAHAGDAGWLRAVGTAWRSDETPPDVAPLAATLPAEPRGVVAWLSAGALPDAARAWANAGGTLLLPRDAPWPLPQPGSPVHDDAGEAVADAAPLGAGRVVRLRRPLQPAAWNALLEPAFPRQLHALVAAPPPAPARAAAVAVAPDDGGAAYAPPPREFPFVIAWLLVALFAFERWLATGRREAAAT